MGNTLSTAYLNNQDKIDNGVKISHEYLRATYDRITNDNQSKNNIQHLQNLHIYKKSTTRNSLLGIQLNILEK